jgi:hypothetical protein
VHSHRAERRGVLRGRAGTHGYKEGAQHNRANTHRTACHNTSVFFLQSAAGAAKWPASDTMLQRLRAAFATKAPPAREKPVKKVKEAGGKSLWGTDAAASGEEAASDDSDDEEEEEEAEAEGGDSDSEQSAQEQRVAQKKGSRHRAEETGGPGRKEKAGGGKKKKRKVAQ